MGQNTAGQRMQGVPVIFRGLRWPAAQSVSSEEASSFVTIHVPRGQRGRIWVPEATDATWRDLAEINLSDEQSCLDFVQRRGDPYYGDPIETAYVPTPREFVATPGNSWRARSTRSRIFGSRPTRTE